MVLAATEKTIMMNRYILIFLFLGLTSSLFAQENFDPNNRILELSGEKASIGITAAYTIDGEMKWSKSAGYKCIEDESPFSSTTITRTASISKSFTAVAVMQLVERNLIALDSPIKKYLANLPADKDEITVRQLLAHTSGIPSYPNSREAYTSTHYESLEEAMNFFIQRPLLSKSGTEYHYTTYGYIILGRIIERVSALNYKDYMQKNIFDIAVMNNTEAEDIDKKYLNKSCLYRNKRKKAKEMEQNDQSRSLPGGGFLSTLEDLLKFGNAVLEEKLISKESVNQMLKTQPVEYKGSNEYGLGWFVYRKKEQDGHLLFGHSGSTIGCSSQIMIAPETKTVVVVLSNTEGKYPDIGRFSMKLVKHAESENE